MVTRSPGGWGLAAEVVLGQTKGHNAHSWELRLWQPTLSHEVLQATVLLTIAACVETAGTSSHGMQTETIKP